MTYFTASFALVDGRHDAVGADMMSVTRNRFVHAHKEVSLFATPLLSQIPLQGIERYLGFWSGRFFLSWWFVGAVCWPLLNRLSVVSRRERLV
jgi:hypothetical protein